MGLNIEFKMERFGLMHFCIKAGRIKRTAGNCPLMAEKFYILKCLKIKYE